MAELSSQEPLPSNAEAGNVSSKCIVFVFSLCRLVLKSLMYVLFIVWAALIFFNPAKFVDDLLTKLDEMTEGTIFGITGSIFLCFSAPILLIAFLAFIYIIAFRKDSVKKKNTKALRYRMWTFPVLVDGPFGIVSAAEFVGLLLFYAYAFWNAIAYIIQSRDEVPSSSLFLEKKSLFMLKYIGLRFGTIGLFCLVFLFLPIARGSIILRLIDIPFEHAARYHVWLGHLTMVLFTLHGLFYVIAWSLQGNLLHKILEWREIGIANLPGVISLAAGILMWITSLHPLRKKYFELFFYTHQLYVIFIVFFALHVGDPCLSVIAGSIFLFILDRFLRFCQSRSTVDIISGACCPCGTMELILSKPANLRYNALSFIFVQVRELSWIQWHPFSVSSSPLDGEHHISILIKSLGEWTEKLRNVISDASEKTQDIKLHRITASIEGPYGHESPYYLLYENLILVAGGIGISPFLAILSDILHRIREKNHCLPRNVLVVWAVKTVKELSLLSTINAQPTGSSVSEKMHLEIQTYVTKELEPSLEQGKLCERQESFSLSVTNGNSMSSLVGTGNNMWSGIYFVASTLGFIALSTLLEVCYIRPRNATPWWYKGLLFTMCMVLGVVMFGGIVIFFWHKWERKCSISERQTVDDVKSTPRPCGGTMLDEANMPDVASMQTIRYGQRPDFKAIFSSFSERAGHVDVGVISCGPPGLQSSVARECRSRNMNGKWNQQVFHFHSHSFDL